MNKLRSLFTPIRLAIVLLALVSLFLVLGPSPTPEKSWPANQAQAPEVSLSFVWSRVTGKTTTDQDVIGEGWRVPTDLVDPEGLDETLQSLDIPEGAPDKVGVLDRYVYLSFGDTTVRAQMPFPSSGFIHDLTARSDVSLTIYENPNFQASAADRIFQLLPIFIILTLLLFMLGRGATKSLGLTSAYDIIEPSKLTHGFEAVAGIDKAREDLDDIVGFLQDPKSASRLGGMMPKGILFCGPPGTGKTLLARAMAKEAGVPFITIEASGVNQIFVGAGAMKVRKAFREARKKAPCIIFIDEIDALGRARGSQSSGGSDEKETTLNALLVELDGFDAREGIVLVAATNRPDILDPALIRRGRIDRRVDVTLPTVKDRESILRVHMRKIKTDEDLAEPVARQTFGMSGADLAAMVNEAALIATRAKRNSVVLDDFLAARDRLIVGQSSSVSRLSEREREITAGHEGGHALIAALNPHSDPIERVTIVPQGGALGFVMQLPTEDRKLETIAHLRARLDVAVAGRLAEELLYGPDNITSGAESDIQLVTNIARSMANRWGMSKKGFIRIEDPLDPLHQGKTSTADAVYAIIEESMARVRTLMTEKKSELTQIRDVLLKKEHMSKEDVLSIVYPDREPSGENGTPDPNTGE